MHNKIISWNEWTSKIRQWTPNVNKLDTCRFIIGERKTEKDEVNEAGQDTCNSALNTDQNQDDSITGIRLSPRSQSEPSVSVELEPRTKPVSILSFGNQAKKYLTQKLSGVALTKSKTKSVTFQLPTASDESDLPLQGPSGISQQSVSTIPDRLLSLSFFMGNLTINWYRYHRYIKMKESWKSCVRQKLFSPLYFISFTSTCTYQFKLW